MKKELFTRIFSAVCVSFPANCKGCPFKEAAKKNGCASCGDFHANYQRDAEQVLAEWIAGETTVVPLDEPDHIGLDCGKDTNVPATAAHIDREAWVPCCFCKSCGNCEEAGKVTGEKINYAHPCHSCLDCDNFNPVAFCRYCGRPITEKAWAELEKRLRG